MLVLRSRDLATKTAQANAIRLNSGKNRKPLQTKRNVKIEKATHLTASAIGVVVSGTGPRLSFSAERGDARNKSLTNSKKAPREAKSKLRQKRQPPIPLDVREEEEESAVEQVARCSLVCEDRARLNTLLSISITSELSFPLSQISGSILPLSPPVSAPQKKKRVRVGKEPERFNSLLS